METQGQTGRFLENYPPLGKFNAACEGSAILEIWEIWKSGKSEGNLGKSEENLGNLGNLGTVPEFPSFPEFRPRVSPFPN